MNENNATIQKEEGINRKFFEQIIENSNLSEEDKKKIGEFKDFKNDTVSEVLKVEDKDKIAIYDKLKVKELPEDWELRLEREKELERLLAENEPKIAELKVWKEVFAEQKPLEIQEKIKKTEEENNKIKEELKEEKANHNLTEQELKTWKETFSSQTASQISEKIKELEEKVKEWTQFFDYRELSEIKQEISELRKRPDLSISENDFYDDYAQRKSIEQNKLDGKELIQSREKIAELEKVNQKMYNSVARFLESRRINRYVLAKPVSNETEAKKEIVELLIKTEEEWSDYLEKGNTTMVSPELVLNCQEKEKKQQAQQILAWIREARTTLDYRILFERWSGGAKYNKENDLDGGSLYLLAKRLEVIIGESLLNKGGQVIADEEIQEGVM
ncbi:MAG: hypothetical protein I3273_05050 [Candidatus Moeniiplasma glomeromycotorum]|nr:hypothetical protein [Candidatus Moeniiplasma glomeromycotorum]MCE8167910.1 hypothetical protein [Candidatus Moeniiplasma glomeromycotorum]MCE8169460.1 hypothetical protein [Candidatus Moeniiplasma glomeromycotorum]